MEPQQPPRSTPPPPPSGAAMPPPPPSSGAASPPPPPSAPAGGAGAPTVTVCPACSTPRAEDTRYCEECGYDYGGQAAPEVEEKSLLRGPILWAFMLFWIVLAVGGLWFLFTVLWAA